MHRYQQRNFFIPGTANRMADDCSRLWHLSDDELLQHFNRTYPQSKPWRLCHLNERMAAAIHAALLCERRPLADCHDELALASPQGPWHLEASPRAHGHRKRLFETLGKRPSSWTTGH